MVASVTKPPASEAAVQELDQSSAAWMQAVLHNWERACRSDLHVPVEPLPWIIFYDDKQAWHLGPDERLLPPHTPSPVTLKFAGRTVPLTVVAHRDGRVWAPGGSPMEIGKVPAVTVPYDDDRSFFFIAPVPGLFHRLAGPEHAADLDEFFLGVTAHELTHTRQVVYAAARVRRLRTRYSLPKNLDDNVIEREFGPNADYKGLYEKERAALSSAILTADPVECRRKVAEALESARVRKQRFFAGDKAGYSELEDVFLVLEGMAMWVQYQTARDRAPAGEDWQKTLALLSERSVAWSQVEGLGLFLLIDRLVPDWQKRFLKPDFPSPFTVLREAVATQAPRGPAAGARPPR
jgi:hypothetical protein